MSHSQAEFSPRVKPVEDQHKRVDQWNDTYDGSNTVKELYKMIVLDTRHTTASEGHIEHGVQNKEADVGGGVASVQCLVWSKDENEKNERESQKAAKRVVDGIQGETVAEEEDETGEKIDGGKPPTVPRARPNAILVAALEGVDKRAEDVPAKGKQTQELVEELERVESKDDNGNEDKQYGQEDG